MNYWGKEQASRHDHYRHPQVLLYEHESGEECELIGIHLKSKHNTRQIIRDDEGNLLGKFLREALTDRIQLASEARNIRQYINAKFDQVARPAILVTGDANDGPGHDFFETQYLFFDVISNVQGDVILAERFFNHALFDFPENLRWSAKFRDRVRNIPASQNPLLLDHILISQPLCKGELALQANPGTGKVEHEAYERANAGANRQTRSSDHRPVTLVLQDSDDG